MKTAIVHTTLVLSLVALSGCVGPQEEVASPGCPAAARRAQAQQEVVSEVPQLGGTWIGQACQSDGPCWSVQIALAWDEDGTPLGNIAYPSVPCKAHLEFVRWEAGASTTAVFRERFDNPGRCVPDGWLRLRLVDSDSLGFEWAYPNGRVDVGTTLDRVQ